VEVLFISNSTYDAGISGGDVRFIEIAKRFQERNIKVGIVTSPEGVALCRRMGLEASFYTVKAQHNSLALGYLEKALKTCLEPPEISSDTIIYSCHDFGCDVIPSFYLKKKAEAKWVATIHWIEPPPWKRGFKNAKEWTAGGLYNLNQVFSILMIKRRADAVHAVSSHTVDQVIAAGIDPNVVREVHCGVDHNLVERSIAGISEKIYDAIYLKSLARHKGIFDAINIWRLVCNELKDAKLAIAGFGSPDQISEMKGLISDLSLEENITYFGPIKIPEEKFKVLKQSKFLLHPSYDENWGIVIGEAMGCGIPVVAYGLPVLKTIWQMGMISIPVGDQKACAQSVISLLRNETLLEKLSEEAKNYSLRYDWDKIAENELESLQSLEL
jgi:glycosyltransferase involved in cell wall biosynthesis